MKRVFMPTFFLSLLFDAGPIRAEDELQKAFANPSEEANAWCYWWWLNGAASREGITRDFEEMKRQGISGALLFDAGQAGPPAPRGPHFMSPEWREMFKHAVREADRLGIALGVNLCSGWNCGGVWVAPEHAAKKLVSAASVVKGPGRVSVELPRPATVQGFYCDIAVLACPLPEGASLEPRLTASSNFPNYPPALAEDGMDNTRWISNSDKPGTGPTPERPEYLQFDYDEAWPAAGLYLMPYSDCGPKEIEIQCSDDGKKYRTLRRATVQPNKELVVPLDETKSAHFRVVFLSSHPFRGQENWNVQVAEIALLTRAELDNPPSDRKGMWQCDAMLDLTEFTDGQGRLTWDAPTGKWRASWNMKDIGDEAFCHGLTNHPESDEQVKKLADALWPADSAASGQRKIRSGRVISGMTLSEIVQADGLAPDIEFRDVSPQARLDWIHRRSSDCEIYFVSNQLEIDVVNLWPNRLIGDAASPPEKRFAVTNVDTYKKGSPLLESGLLGPVTLQKVIQ